MVYTTIQKIFLPFVTIPCIALMAGLLRYGEAQTSKQDDRYDNRFRYAYMLAAGTLLGKYLTIYGAMNPLHVFIFVGIIVMIILQRLGALLPTRNREVDIKFTIDEESFEDKDNVEIDAEGDNPNQNYRITKGEDMSKQKRKRIALVLYIVISLLCVIEGIALSVDRPDVDNGYRVAAYWLSKVQETFVLSVVMIFALYHIKKAYGTRWYLPFMITWCVLVGLSTFPVLVDMSDALATVIITHPFIIITRSALYGVVLFFVFHFLNSCDVAPEKRVEIISLLILTASGSLAWVSGFFL